jgi:hypothetical protein
MPTRQSTIPGTSIGGPLSTLPRNVRTNPISKAPQPPLEQAALDTRRPLASDKKNPPPAASAITASTGTQIDQKDRDTAAVTASVASAPARSAAPTSISALRLVKSGPAVCIWPRCLRAVRLPYPVHVPP